MSRGHVFSGSYVMAGKPSKKSKVKSKPAPKPVAAKPKLLSGGNPQIAKAYGAQVTGVASSAKLELVRSIGAGVRLIPDGDIAGVIWTTDPAQTGVDIYLGSGGAPEGVLAAAALTVDGGARHGLRESGAEQREELAQRRFAGHAAAGYQPAARQLAACCVEAELDITLWTLSDRRQHHATRMRLLQRRQQIGIVGWPRAAAVAFEHQPLMWRVARDQPVQIRIVGILDRVIRRKLAVEFGDGFARGP